MAYLCVTAAERRGWSLIPGEWRRFTSTFNTLEKKEKKLGAEVITRCGRFSDVQVKYTRHLFSFMFSTCLNKFSFYFLSFPSITCKRPIYLLQSLSRSILSSIHVLKESYTNSFYITFFLSFCTKKIYQPSLSIFNSYFQFTYLKSHRQTRFPCLILTVIMF